MVSLVVVDHSFVEETQRKRWRLLAERHGVDVTLLLPRKWKSEWFGEPVVYRPEKIDAGNFRQIPLCTTSQRDWMKYFFVSPDARFRSIAPDVIHVQYSEMALIHHQIILYKKLWSPDSKLTFFSMNALGVPQDRWHHRLRWNHLKANADAALVHYPGCLDSLRSASFDKPVFLQTSYGVDEELFRPDDSNRIETREALDFSGRFVIGYVGRLIREKGVDDLLNVLPLDGVDWSLLLVGDGEMRGEIERVVASNGWEDRVEITGYVPQDEVPGFIRAMDCFVLGSKTQDDWVDTFPRSIVQAMASEVPVIGSDSGAIPFQVRDAGLIFEEGNRSALEAHLYRLAGDDELRERLGREARRESIERFGQETLADNFYKILQQVHTGNIRYGSRTGHAQYEAYR